MHLFLPALNEIEWELQSVFFLHFKGKKKSLVTFFSSVDSFSFSWNFLCYAFWILHPNHLPFPSWFLSLYIFPQCFEGRLEFCLLNYLFWSQEWPESSNCLLNCLVGKLCYILYFQNVSFGLNLHKCYYYFCQVIISF